MAPSRYGQHFLVNPGAINQIIGALDLMSTDRVLEIGPGRGALTSKLVESVGFLALVEIDKGLFENLSTRYSSAENVAIFNNDILKFDLRLLSALGHSGVRYKVVGNLPYNITSPILRRLTNWDEWTLACFMVQKEVGDRLCAKVGTGEYGALTVGMNLTCEMEKIFDLTENSFRPQPKVQSSVVRFKRRPVPLTSDVKGTQRVIQAAFQQRRKTILNSLTHGLNLEKEKVCSVVNRVGLSEKIRPERISVDQFVELSKGLNVVLK